MLTNYKKENLKELVEGNHNLYNEFSLIGDKLRTIYTSLGWTHMTKNFSESDNLVELLTNNVLESLSKDKKLKDIVHASGGLQVCGYFDEEEFLNLDYSFNII